MAQERCLGRRNQKETKFPGVGPTGHIEVGKPVAIQTAVSNRLQQGNPHRFSPGALQAQWQHNALWRKPVLCTAGPTVGRAASPALPNHPVLLPITATNKRAHTFLMTPLKGLPSSAPPASAHWQLVASRKNLQIKK